jgi:DNA-binding CsgD family transcriptional regulator
MLATRCHRPGALTIRQMTYPVRLRQVERLSVTCRMPDMDELNENRLRLPLALLLGVIAVGAAFDLFLDRPTQWNSFHVLYELAIVVATALTASWLWRGWHRSEREGVELRRSLSERQAERDAWRTGAERALAGFGEAVDRQFTAWRLTPAEREVALLVLKGGSHKEIAAQTGRSERTVRQHAAAAYEKEGLDGRAALAAYFLEGVKLPPATD